MSAARLCVVLAACLAGTAGCLIISVDADDVPGAGYSRGEITESYENVSTVQINTTSGDCTVRTSDDGLTEVRLLYTVRPAGAMTPGMHHDRESGKLTLSETWQPHQASGRVHWILEVPPQVTIVFDSASGNLVATDLAGDLSARTASGDITASRMSGVLTAETSSGDIFVRGCTGPVRATSASGRIHKG